MDWIGLTLNSICLSFIIFLMYIYFSKKSIENVDNKCYRYILLSCFFLVFSDLLFVLLCYFTSTNLFLIGLSKRLAFLMILLFFVSIAYYVIFISLENNEKAQNLLKKHNKKIRPIMTIIVGVISFFQFILPINYVYKANNLVWYIDGFGTNPYASVVSAFLIALVVPTLIKNWKSIDKKRLSPFVLLLILELIVLLVNTVIPSLCLASLSLTLSCYWMYFTIENPDIKVIAQLEYAKSQAEKSNNAKSDFLSSMSHEIRTPLNAIVGLSQMMKETDDIESIHNDLDDVIIASQNLLEIVNGILDISKLEANKMEIIQTNYKPRDVLANLIKLMNIRIGSKPLTLRTHYADNLPEELYGDKEKLKQILTNLLTNAIKYTNEGFVDFTIDCINNKDICNMIITVKDTGRGMKEEQLPNLFSKFNRLEEDKDSNIEGTGLGLAITKSLVELFDGTIEVESKYGEGSTFIVKLPQKIIKEAQPIIHNEEPVSIMPPKLEELESNNNASIVSTESQHQQRDTVDDNTIRHNALLVVDDNKINLKVASKILQDCNYNVDTAHSGFECLEKINSNKEKYDVVFMDIMMPDMDGVETMKKLKAVEGFDKPVIALTADSMEGSREKYLAAGFDDYVSKPIIKDILEKTLQKHIDLDKIEIVTEKNEDSTTEII